MSTLERAIEIATQAHKGQKDKAGNDYIGHSLCHKGFQYMQQLNNLT